MQFLLPVSNTLSISAIIWHEGGFALGHFLATSQGPGLHKTLAPGAPTAGGGLQIDSRARRPSSTSPKTWCRPDAVSAQYVDTFHSHSNQPGRIVACACLRTYMHIHATRYNCGFKINGQLHCLGPRDFAMPPAPRCKCNECRRSDN